MQIITLETMHTTYQMAVSDNGYLLHVYYGKKTSEKMDYLLTFYDRGFVGNPYDVGNDRTFSLDALPQEYPVYGNGDYRTPALRVKDEKGIFACDLRYVAHTETEGKYSIPGLPSVYADQTPAKTVDIVLEDTLLGLEVTLRYGIFYDLDVITRCAVIRNKGQQTLTITKVMSASMDFVTGRFDLLHFYGRHGMERTMERVQLKHGLNKYGSNRGTSSHQENPFLILADHTTTEDAGNCYGMSFLYSGNFQCEIEKDQINQTRLNMGIQEDMFECPLKPGEQFDTPEVAMAFSSEGLTHLSHLYHELIRYHVCRGPYRDVRRPVLINNWEATYFDFTGEKIIDIAKEAASLGVEMLVLDDGWFGNRNSDKAGLGDWFVNEDKLGGSLKSVVECVNACGMQFGLWIEPEMVNEDSELYRQHPDWAFVIPGRKPVRSRYQLALDFSREEVVDYIFNAIAAVLDDINVKYIKMDLNRSIGDVYSATASYQNCGLIMHQYVLGVYRFLDKMLERYPNLMIEGCSGGGGRFDAGMLYYTPQIWCSDNTDAIERITIQHGTSFGYPISTVGSHVSDVPNHQTKRVTPINTRSVVAMAGSFGYELDLNLITDEEKDAVCQQIEDYKRYWPLIHNGLYYRLHTPGEDTEMAAWCFVDKTKKEALLNVVSLTSHCNAPVQYIYLKGLDEKTRYRMEHTDYVFTGAALMYGGIAMPAQAEEYCALQMHFIEEPETEEE